MQDPRLGDLDGVASAALDDLVDEVISCGHPRWVIFEPGAGGRLRRHLLRGDPAPHQIDLPPWCIAVGVVATGRVVPLDPAPGAGGDEPVGELALAYVVDREGRTGWRIQPDPGVALDLTAPSEGVMVDAVRRVLGLETAPPPCPVDVVSAVAWLRSIRELGEGQAVEVSWSDAVAVLPDPPADDWEDLRLAMAFGDIRCPEVMSADEAMWMDEGMFARHLLRCLPDLGRQWADTEPYLAPEASRLIAHLLHVA